MDWKKIVSSLLIVGIYLTFSIINEYKTKVEFIENHGLSIILGVIILILFNQYNTDSSIRAIDNEISEKIKNLKNNILDIDQKTMEIVRNGKAGLITEIKATQVFNDYVGKNYYAYNAPLQYELENLNERIEFHINRYKDYNFEMAHYYYPIFATKDINLRNNWMRGVYDFYKQLANCSYLDDKEKKK